MQGQYLRTFSSGEWVTCGQGYPSPNALSFQSSCLMKANVVVFPLEESHIRQHQPTLSDLELLEHSMKAVCPTCRRHVKKVTAVITQD